MLNATNYYRFTIKTLQHNSIFGKSVIGSNIHIEVNERFTHLTLWIVFLKLSQRFGFSTRSLGHVMFSFAGTAQEAGAMVDRGQLVSLFATKTYS